MVSNEAERGGFPTVPGYDLLASAGSGGTADVFKARRISDGAEVAVKVLRMDRDDAEPIRNEFAVLSALSHPNIIEALDFGFLADGRPYAVFPWMEAAHPDASCFRDSAGWFTAGLFASAARQIATALGAAHSRNIVHGDLKPENIFIRFEDGNPVVLLADFGFSRVASDQTVSLSGTAEYIAPELLRGAPPDQGSDLYALGCILHEFLTGSPPFTGANPREVFEKHLSGSPPEIPASDGIPDEFILWTRTLLEKDPALRYRTAAQLKDDIDLFLGESGITSDSEPPPFAFPEIQRQVERAKLLEIWSASGGSAISAVIDGPRGAGKTSMLRNLRARMLLDGASVETAVPRNGDPPFRPVLDVLRRIRHDALEGEQRERAAAIAAVFGDAFQGARLPEPPPLPADAEKLRLFHAASSLLTEASGLNALMIDDADHADSFTREFIPFLLAHMSANSGTGFFLLLTAEEADPEWDKHTAARVTLPAFSREAVDTALSKLLKIRIPQSFLSVAMRLSEGLPGRIVEFLEFCRGDGILARSGGAWMIHERENLAAAFPASAEDAFKRKLDRLRAGDRELLTAAALTPVPVPVRTLQHVLRLPPLDFAEALSRLREGGFIELDSDVISPLHPILSRLLTTDENRSVTYHDRYLEWHSARKEDERDIFATAHHAAASSSREASPPLLYDAAVRSRRLFDYRTAGRLLEKALEIVRDPGKSDERFELLSAMCEISNLLGNRNEEEEHLEEMLVLAARSGSPEKLSAVYRRQTEYHLAVGEFERARKSAEKALAHCEQAGDKACIAWCHRKIGFADYRTKPNASVIGHYEKAIDAYRTGMDLSAEADTLVDIGLVYYSILDDPERSIEHFDRARSLFESTGDKRGLIRADGNAGAQLYALGEYESALECHKRAHSIARETGDRRFLATSLGSMGQCELALARYSDAWSHMQEELRIAREIRDTWLQELCLENLGELYLVLGAYDRSIESYGQARELAVRSGNLVGAAACDIDIAGALIEKQDADSAIKLLKAARQTLDENHDLNVSAMLLYRTGMLHMSRGPYYDPVKALDYFRNLGDEADDHGFRSYSILARSYAGICLANNGRPNEGLDMSASAVDMLDSGGPIYGGCQDVLLNHALVLRAVRDNAASLSYIDRAHEELMNAAASITDVHLYRSFLEQVRSNAEIIREHTLAHRSDSKSAIAAVREQNLRTLYEVARKINSMLQLPPLLDAIMDGALEAMNGERGLIFLLENDQLVLKVSRNVEKETIRDATEISLSILRDVISGGKPIIVADATQDAEFKNRESVRNFRIHSLICVPMRAKDRLIGTVYVDSRADALQAMSFSDIDAEFLEAFANLAAIAIENARMHSHLQEENIQLRRTVTSRFGFENIIGESAPMQRLFAETQAAINSEGAVLISGESGTGKELVAKAIHFNGARKSHRFVAVDCGALPDTLLESELFGYKRGAFTGAYTDKPGLFEEAHNGTLFLDEISNTSLAFQAKLLRVLQDGEYRRVGDTAIRTVNVRIICATNRNLATEIDQGRFRQDLFYRLNVIPIVEPPLRDRLGDLPMLIQHFIDLYKSKNPSPVTAVTSECIDVLRRMPWKGNVRALENLITRMMTQSGNNTLSTRELPPEYQSADTQSHTADDLQISFSGPRRLMTLQQAEREHIQFVIQHTKGNKTEAAKLLGLKRTTLIEKMKKLGIM